MERTKPIKKSGVIEDLHHLQLMALLQELVRKRGYTGAARELKVDQRTISSSMKAGRLSQKTRWALERALQYGVGSAAAEQRERNDKLEDRLDNLEKTIRSSLKELRTDVDKMRKDLARQRRRVAVLARAREDPKTGTPDDDENGASSTSNGPPWWRPGGLNEQPSAGLTELIFEWRQALTSLMVAEERLSTAVERDAGLLVDSDDMVEASAGPRIARSVRLSRRRRARTWIEESTLAAPEK